MLVGGRSKYLGHI